MNFHTGSGSKHSSVEGACGAVCPGSVADDGRDNHSSSSNAKVKNEWKFSSATPIRSRALYSDLTFRSTAYDQNVFFPISDG